jgi:hypothetical protein
MVLAFSPFLGLVIAAGVVLVMWLPARALGRWLIRKGTEMERDRRG